GEIAQRRLARHPPRGGLFPVGEARFAMRTRGGTLASAGRVARALVVAFLLRLNGAHLGVPAAPITQSQQCPLHRSNGACFTVPKMPITHLPHRSRRNSLPERVRGSGAEANSTRFGTLYGASRAEQCSRSAPSSTVACAASTTIAVTASPQRSSARPSTAASSTAGCASSTASTSLGATFSPPV